MNHDTYNRLLSLRKNSAFLIIVFVLMANLAGNRVYSQNNLKSDTIRSDSNTIVKYLTPMEYAFMMHEKTSWLVKLGVVTKSYGMNNFYYAAIEKRVLPTFTLNFSADFGTYVEDYESEISLAIETRWYYQLNKRVKERQTERNMSDNYLAFGIGKAFYLNNVREDNAISAYFKWGMQRRFLNFGYADFNIKAGIDLPVYGHLHFIFSTNTNLGIAFTKDKYKLNREKLCPVLKCYSAEKHVFKTNLNGLFYFSYHNAVYKALYFTPSLAFEHKIGSTPFSVNTEIIGFYNQYIITSYGAELSVESRWYYNLHRHILKGKTGNGLSANYITVGGSYKYYHEEGNETFHDYIPSIYIATGWQRLYSKHLYTDIKIGIGYQFKTKHFPGYHNNGSVIFPLHFGVGYRF